jgi:curved DNA-binding protein CbpA
MKDYYLVLELPRGASPRAVRATYRRLLKRHHPDVAGPEGARAVRRIVEAYRVLSDPERRRRYDAELARLERACVSVAAASRRENRAAPEIIEPLVSPVARPRPPGVWPGGGSSTPVVPWGAAAPGPEPLVAEPLVPEPPPEPLIPEPRAPGALRLGGLVAHHLRRAPRRW